MVDDLIAAALQVAGNTHSVADVHALAARGDAVIWAGEKSVAVTDYFITPKVKALNFWLLGGDLRELLSMLPAIEAWGRANGCTHCMGSGRAAWGRALRRYGFEPTHTVFEKEL